MSQPSLARPGGEAAPQKQPYNIYTVMLIISLICIVTSCFLLYKELQRWGNYPWWNTSDATPRAAWLLDSPAPSPHEFLA